MCRPERRALLPTLAAAILLLPLASGVTVAGQARGTLNVGVRVVSPCHATADHATVRQSCPGEGPATVIVEGAAAQAADPRAADLPLPVVSGGAAGGPAYLTLIY
jgi:hypothetical protein